VGRVANGVATYAFAGAGVVAGAVMIEVTRRYGIFAHTYGPPTSAENVAVIVDGALLTVSAIGKSVSVAAHTINELVIHRSVYSEAELTAPSSPSGLAPQNEHVL